MIVKKPMFESIESYIQNYPIQLQISNHNGKIKAQSKLNQLIETHGIKKVDGAWDCMLNIQGLSFNGKRLGDLGENFHKAFNSKLTLFMQNGSSMGNQVVCLVLAHKKVLIQANSHVSVYTGLSLANAEIILVEPHYNSDFDIHEAITAQQVQDAIQRHPDIHAIYLTSPSYEGLVANYKEIKSVIGDRLLIIDEAHGAIHYFNSNMPQPSLLSDADISVCSMHKSLGTLVGTALINVSANSKITNKKVLDAYYTYATTSPNLIMVASVDDAVNTLSQSGQQDVDFAILLNKKFRTNISTIKNVFIDNFERIRMDPMKTIFGIFNLSGQELQKTLEEEYNIAVEKSTDLSVIVTIHINSEENDIDNLTNAITQIARKQNKRNSRQFVYKEESLYVKITKKRNMILSLSKVQAAEKEERKIGECIGRISGDLKYSCPPGYPYLIFGEEILVEHVQLLGEDYIVEVVVEN